MSHTILLIQASESGTKTFHEFEGVKACMEGVCKIFDKILLGRYPDKENITYDIVELFDYLDQLTNVTCLVHQNNANGNMYVSHNKQWIKRKLFEYLRKKVNE